MALSNDITLRHLAFERKMSFANGGMNPGGERHWKRPGAAFLNFVIPFQAEQPQRQRGRGHGSVGLGVRGPGTRRGSQAKQVWGSFDLGCIGRIGRIGCRKFGRPKADDLADRQVHGRSGPAARRLQVQQRTGTASISTLWPMLGKARELFISSDRGFNIQQSSDDPDELNHSVAV